MPVLSVENVSFIAFALAQNGGEAHLPFPGVSEVRGPTGDTAANFSNTSGSTKLRWHGFKWFDGKPSATGCGCVTGSATSGGDDGVAADGL